MPEFKAVVLLAHDTSERLHKTLYQDTMPLPIMTPAQTLHVLCENCSVASGLFRTLIWPPHLVGNSVTGGLNEYHHSALSEGPH